MQFAPAHENLQRFHLSRLFWVPLLDVIKNLLKGLRKNSTVPVACGVPSNHLASTRPRSPPKGTGVCSGTEFRPAGCRDCFEGDRLMPPDGLGATFDDDGVLFVNCRLTFQKAIPAEGRNI